MQSNMYQGESEFISKYSLSFRKVGLQINISFFYKKEKKTLPNSNGEYKNKHLNERSRKKKSQKQNRQTNKPNKQKPYKQTKTPEHYKYRKAGQT